MDLGHGRCGVFEYAGEDVVCETFGGDDGTDGDWELGGNEVERQ
jgi:hypothetical protein